MENESGSILFLLICLLLLVILFLYRWHQNGSFLETVLHQKITTICIVVTGIVLIVLAVRRICVRCRRNGKEKRQ